MVLQRRESPVDLPVDRRPDATPVEDKVALVREAESSARSQDEKLLRQVTVGYADTIQQVTIANTEGVYVEDERVRCRMAVNAVAAEGPVIQTGYDSRAEPGASSCSTRRSRRNSGGRRPGGRS